MGAATMTFDLQPHASGTLITLAGRADPPGLLKLFDPIMGLLMRGHFHDHALRKPRTRSTWVPECPP